MSTTEARSRGSDVLTEADAELVERLEEEATARWGDEWAISIRRWADGSASIYAEHIAGSTPEGHRRKERLMPDGDGGFGYDVVVKTRAQTVDRDVLARDV